MYGTPVNASNVSSCISYFYSALKSKNPFYKRHASIKSVPNILKLLYTVIVCFFGTSSRIFLIRVSNLHEKKPTKSLSKIGPAK